MIRWELSLFKVCWQIDVVLFVSLYLAGDGLVGMRQRDLIMWYVHQQFDENNDISEKEAASEIKKVKTIIEV